MRLRRTLTEVADAADQFRSTVSMIPDDGPERVVAAAESVADSMATIASCFWLYGAVLVAVVIVHTIWDD